MDLLLLWIHVCYSIEDWQSEIASYLGMEVIGGEVTKNPFKRGWSWDFTKKYTYIEVKLSKKLYGTFILETEVEG